jgi:16S rRNA (adenine1518-N6/adenine1519-N6)-dimethyltransferase
LPHFCGARKTLLTRKNSICGKNEPGSGILAAVIKAKKSLGQNFLVDPNALSRIAEAANVREGETVIEIGPGTGLLTKELLGKPLEKLIAYEVDDRAIELLHREIRDPRFELRHQDFLEADLREFGTTGSLRIVGNIPYYITSPILFKLIDDRRFLRDALLLMQLEVAERLTAQPRSKEYGIPTVLTNFFAKAEFLFTIKAASFRPAPKVDSALVRIDFTQGYFARSQTSKPDRFDEEAFRKLVRTAFAMRRKMLRNNLKTLVDEATLSKPEVQPYLPRRAEELSVVEFIHLYTIIQE